MIRAYTEFNLGDDLFIKILCERYPDTQFVVIGSKDYNLAFKDIPNLKVYSSFKVRTKIINYIFYKIRFYSLLPKFLVKKSDAVVHIGGSLFIEDYNWEKSFHNNRSIYRKHTVQPYFLLGANFGPFLEEEYYNCHKQLFKGYTDICFREKYTYDLFKDLGNVRIAPDIVFQLKPFINTENVSHQKYITISVIKPSFRTALKDFDDLYYEKLKDISIYFIDRGYKVLFLSFCKLEKDEEAIESIIKRIPVEYAENVETHLYRTDMNLMISIIASAELVIATRFHSMILGWVLNRPVFPISYSDKMINVMNDVNFQGNYVDFKGLKSLNTELVFESMEHNMINVSAQVIDAERHFEKLDSYLLGAET